MNHQKADCGGQRIGGSSGQKQGDHTQRHQRGIGQRLFQIALPQRHDRGHQRRHQPRRAKRQRPCRRAPQNRVQPRQKIDPRLDHRGRVQIGRNRRRRGHGIGQPEMKRKLRRFGECTKQNQYQDRAIYPAVLQARPGQDLHQIHTARLDPHQDQPGQQRQPSGPGHQHRLQRIAPGLRPVMVEADQQIGGHAGQFPEHEQRDQITGQHQPQHRDHEGDQIQHETPETRMSAHIADRIKQDQRADPADHQRKDQRQPVHHETQRDAQLRRPFPGQGHDLARVDGRQHPAQPQRDHGGAQGCPIADNPLAGARFMVNMHFFGPPRPAKPHSAYLAQAKPRWKSKHPLPVIEVLYKRAFHAQDTAIALSDRAG